MNARPPGGHNRGAGSDQAALAAIGERVRARLDADPAVHRIAVEEVELYAVSGFLSPAECAHFIGLIDAVARPSPTYDEGATYRTSWSGDVDPGDSFVRMVERRIADLTGFDERWGETVQGQRYEPGQEFQAHYDWFQTDGAYWPQERANGGQRSWTVMAYLNDVEEGGETEFPKIRASIPPQEGVLIAWNNARRDGRPNPATLHAARPVIRGTKYVFTKWFRSRAWG